MVAKICTYRVLQEALNNAYWHGDSGAPTVTAQANRQALRLTISNAAGPPDVPSDKAEGRNLGLRGMRFRVESLGGALRVDFGSGDVTKIEAEIPLAAPATHRGDSNVPGTPLS